MDETLRHQRDTSLAQLEALIRRGREIRQALGARGRPLDESRGRQPRGSVDATRAWQQDCAAAITQLSGGSKAHWLARAYSGAFMVRSEDGTVVVEADATEIVDRMLDVLAQGVSSLSSMDEVETASSGASRRPRRFEFVHRVESRPVCEQALDDSRAALARNECALALILSCGVIEAVITDALEHSAIQSAMRPSTRSAGSGSTASLVETATSSGRPESVEGRNPQSAMTFEERIAEAERAGLIRGGCARLPPVARTYRDLTDGDGELRPDMTVSAREARVAGQVLQVVMRDLDPSR